MALLYIYSRRVAILLDGVVHAPMEDDGDLVVKEMEEILRGQAREVGFLCVDLTEKGIGEVQESVVIGEGHEGEVEGFEVVCEGKIGWVLKEFEGKCAFGCHVVDCSFK